MSRHPSSLPVPTVADKLIRAFERFVRVEALSGIVLLVAAAVALIWANSPAAPGYHALWHARLGVTLGGHDFSRSLHFWINDGLMTIFFFVVGMEIRREMRDGALASLQLAALPLAAAVGGVIVPALIYLAINIDPQLQHGWAVPTATDIAFAVGVLALLGKSIPGSLRIFLLALAIIDDIAAVLIIAIFYAGGVHLTLVGVALGLLMPARFERVEHALHPWVAYGIMPLFALANAGVSLGGVDLTNSGSAPVILGTVIALVLGKPLGIYFGSRLAVFAGWCRLPDEVTWRGIALVGCLGGIGFTMSIFIATLAFQDEQLLTAAKCGVLLASVLAGSIGLALGRMQSRKE